MQNFYHFYHFYHEDKLLHAVTTKSSSQPYQFSLAFHTGENHKEIMKNRQKISNYFLQSSPLSFVVPNQTHSDHIHMVTQHHTQGWEQSHDAIKDCDALITNIPHTMLTILTADCVPILLYDKKKQVIAAVHAGWKGTQAKILSKTVHKMIDYYGCLPEDIMVGIAPSIGACCYEVDNDVAKYFSNIPHAYNQIKDKYMLDLPYINKQQLLSQGIKEMNIEMSDICTACEVERFFSYRKENECTGRFMSMIALKEGK